MEEQNNQNLSTEHSDSNENIQYLTGLGGWLILVAIGLILTPIRIGLYIYGLYTEIILTGGWEALTTEGTEFYTPYFDILMIFETALNFLLGVASIYALFLFFNKKKAFPNFFIGIVVFTIAFIIVDALVASYLFSDIKAFDEETLRELGKGILAGMIWVPYMKVSIRVKNTFVNP